LSAAKVLGAPMLHYRKARQCTAAAGLLAAALSMAGCAGSRDVAYESGGGPGADADKIYAQAVVAQSSPTTRPQTRVITASAPLQCVPYARRISNVSIRGNAWTWWQSAEGRYRRNQQPAVGSVLVLRRTTHLRYGHVAVVSRVLNNREILVDHANWLNRGRIYKDLPVKDVSPNNDWSLVRVWYEPGNTLGKRQYPAYGFIHPRARVLRLQEPTMQGPDVRVLQERLIDEGFDVATDGVFDPKTRDALVAFQGRMGLVQDGIASPSTRASLGI
jgi:surface antigen